MKNSINHKSNNPKNKSLTGEVLKKSELPKPTSSSIQVKDVQRDGKIESKSHYLFIAILMLIYVTMIIITNPAGDFPLNDDWTYAHPVLSLLNTGKFGSLGLGSQAMVIAQVFWGYVFCIFTGFSFTALRFSTLILGLAGAIFFYYLTYDLTKSKRLSFIAALLLLINPLNFSVANSFMTDVPFVSVLLGSIYFFFKCIDTGKWKYFVLASLFSALAVLIRQFGVIIPISFAITLVLNKRRSLIQRVQYVIPLAATIVSYLLANAWLKHIGAEPHSELSRIGNNFISNPQLWIQEVFNKAGNDLFYFGLLFFPLLLITINLKSLKFNYISMVCLAAIAASFIFLYRQFPFGNYLNNGYIGPLSLSVYPGGNFLGDNGRFPFNVIIILYIFGISGAILSLINLRALLVKSGNFLKILFEENSEKSKYLFILLSALLYAFINYFTSIGGPGYDRYLIPLFPLFGLLVIPEPKSKLMLSIPFVVIVIAYISIMGLFSAFGTHDYLAWNRARQNAVDYLTKDKKISMSKVDAGMESNGWALGFDGRKWNHNKQWFGLVDGNEYMLALTDEADEFLSVNKFPYRCDIPPHNRYLYAMHGYHAFLDEGLDYIQRGKTDSADMIIKKFQDKVKDKPIANWHTSIGILYAQKKMYKEAEQEFHKEISLNLHKDDAYVQMGMMYFHNRDADKAIVAFDSAKAVNPKSADAYNNLGCCYLNFKGDNRKAQELFIKTVELDPNYTQAYYNILISAYNVKDFDSFIKYSKTLLRKGHTINEIKGLGMTIPEDVLKKINS